MCVKRQAVVHIVCGYSHRAVCARASSPECAHRYSVRRRAALLRACTLPARRLGGRLVSAESPGYQKKWWTRRQLCRHRRSSTVANAERGSHDDHVASRRAPSQPLQARDPGSWQTAWGLCGGVGVSSSFDALGRQRAHRSLLRTLSSAAALAALAVLGVGFGAGAGLAILAGLALAAVLRGFLPDVLPPAVAK